MRATILICLLMSFWLTGSSISLAQRSSEKTIADGSATDRVPHYTVRLKWISCALSNDEPADQLPIPLSKFLQTLSHRQIQLIGVQSTSEPQFINRENSVVDSWARTPATNALGLTPEKPFTGADQAIGTYSSSEPTRAERGSTTTQKPYLIAWLTKDQADQFRQYLSKHRRISITEPPSLTMPAGQAVTISDGSSQPIVSNFTEIKGDFATAVEPKISLLQHGTTMEFMLSHTSDDSVSLECQINQTKVDSIKSQQLASEDPNQPFSIQYPVVENKYDQFQVILDKDQYALVLLGKATTVGRREKIRNRFLPVLGTTVELATVDKFEAILITVEHQSFAEDGAN